MKKYLVVLAIVMAASPSVAMGEPVASPTDPGQTAAQAAVQKPKPHIIVSSFQVSPQPVEPGVNFTLSVDVLNTSKKNVENLLVSIGGIDAADGGEGQGGGSPTFATRATGNSRFIDVLEAGATGKVSFELAAAPRADPGLYMARVDLNYTGDGNDFSSNQTVGISVNRTAEFDFPAVKAPEKVTVGEGFPLSFEVVNSSGFTVQGVALSLKGNGLAIENGSNIIGALESGDSDAVEANVRATKPGRVQVRLIVRYRDDFNKLKTVRRFIDITVEPKPHLKTKAVKAIPSGGVFQSLAGFFKALFGLG